MSIRPLYVSPTGRGGVDIGIQNILRAVKRAGLTDAELLRMPERYNFAPMLLPYALPRGWSDARTIIQARSRVAFALKQPGIPLVTTVHHLTTDPRLQPVSSLAQRVFYRLVESQFDGWSVAKADAVVCVSKYTQKMTEQTYGRKDTHLIYDGIDTDVFTPAPEGVRLDELPPSDARIRLLFVGNRTRRKGFDLLPKIMDLLPHDYVLYYTASFQAGVDTNPHPRMIPIGTPDRDGLVAAYRSADIMLFPSRLEGFGIAPAEALACGVPVVTTNASALPEVVDHFQSGVLVETNDVPGYAHAVRQLGEDAALRREYGQFGREKVARAFGYDMLGSAFAQLYAALLN
ncbi:MAG: glycosyltransferase family 4 protein [Chloroflexi bacterium]|nr:glycosyltransferase family 4 protein [Chloroflexota bacterium]